MMKRILLMIAENIIVNVINYMDWVINYFYKDGKSVNKEAQQSVQYDTSCVALYDYWKNLI